MSVNEATPMFRKMSGWFLGLWNRINKTEGKLIALKNTATDLGTTLWQGGRGRLGTRSAGTEKIIYFILKIYFIDYAITVVPFTPFIPLHSDPPPTRILPPLSSCPRVIHISSLAYPFPILSLTSSCLFCTYHLCFLFPVPFPTFPPLPFPTENPPCDLHFSGSVPVLVVCLVFVFVF